MSDRGVSSPIDLAREDDFVIGALRVSPSICRVNRPKDLVAVEPRVMQVFVSLVRAGGAVVSRDDLIQSCWGGRLVGDDAINRCVAKVRQLAKDESGTHFVIETIPRVGYLLSAATGQGADAKNETAGPASLSICVLPFTNMSGDVEQDYFSDGISEDIITDLSKVPELFVIARNTAFTYKGVSVDAQQVARELKASHILEGSVRKVAGRVRISAQLIDGRTGGHIWAERFDRDLDDIFALQDEISAAIVTALKLQLLPEERGNTIERDSANAAAFDLYSHGIRPAFGQEDRAAAIAVLEAATRLAPNHAKAWAALARVRSMWRLYRPLNERDELAKLVTLEADRALKLDSRNLTALIAKFLLVPPFGRFFDSDVHTQRMLEVAPHDADALYYRAAHLVNVGCGLEAVQALRQGLKSDPANPAVITMLGSSLLNAGQYEEARQILEANLARWPTANDATINLIALFARTGDWASIDGLLSPERLKKYPLWEFEAYANALVSEMRTPSPVSQNRFIKNARRRYESSKRVNFPGLAIAAELGALDEAYEIAAKGMFAPAGDDGDELGIDAFRPYLLFSSLWPTFRRDPRFIQLCARLGLVEYWLKTQHWPDCVEELAPYYDFKAACARVAAEIRTDP